MSESGSSSSGGPHPGCCAFNYQFGTAGAVDFRCCLSRDAWMEIDRSMCVDTTDYGDPIQNARRDAFNAWDGKLYMDQELAGGEPDPSWPGTCVPYQVLYYSVGGTDYRFTVVWTGGEILWVNRQIDGTSPSAGRFFTYFGTTNPADCCRIVYSHHYVDAVEGPTPVEGGSTLYIRNNRCCKCSDNDGITGKPGCAELPNGQTRNCTDGGSGSGSSSESTDTGFCPDDLISAICPCECPPDLPSSVVVKDLGGTVLDTLTLDSESCAYYGSRFTLSWSGNKWSLYDSLNDVTYEAGETGCYQPEGGYGTLTVE